MITIAIDCGASFIKGARFREGKIEEIKRYRSPHVNTTKSVFEIQQISLLTSAVHKMILDLAGNEKKIKLCISNEMHGFILTHFDGTPYTDYISWQKELGAVKINGEASVEMLNDNSGLRGGVVNSGMPLRAGLPSCNLFYLKLTERLSDEKSYYKFYTLGDYILKNLSQVEPMCHPTNAAATGLYDLCKNDWNEKYIMHITDGSVLFPRVGDAEVCFLMDGIEVHALPAIGDQQAALLGAGLKEGDISFNIGTGSQVSSMTSQVVLERNYQLRPFFNGKYLKTIPHIPAGRALNVYVRFIKSVLNQYNIELSEDDIWNGLIESEKSSTGSDIYCNMSFFENAMDTMTKGSILNIGEYDFNIGSLMKSVFKQVSCNLVTMADCIEPEHEKLKRVVFTGGVAKRIVSIRNQILSNYLGVEHIICDNETLIGLYKYGNTDF